MMPEHIPVFGRKHATLVSKTRRIKDVFVDIDCEQPPQVIKYKGLFYWFLGNNDDINLRYVQVTHTLDLDAMV